MAVHVVRYNPWKEQMLFDIGRELLKRYLDSNKEKKTNERMNDLYVLANREQYDMEPTEEQSPNPTERAVLSAGLNENPFGAGTFAGENNPLTNAPWLSSGNTPSFGVPNGQTLDSRLMEKNSVLPQFDNATSDLSNYDFSNVDLAKDGSWIEALAALGNKTGGAPVTVENNVPVSNPLAIGGNAAGARGFNVGNIGNPVRGYKNNILDIVERFKDLPPQYILSVVNPLLQTAQSQYDAQKKARAQAAFLEQLGNRGSTQDAINKLIEARTLGVIDDKTFDDILNALFPENKHYNLNLGDKMLNGLYNRYGFGDTNVMPMGISPADIMREQGLERRAAASRAVALRGQNLAHARGLMNASRRDQFTNLKVDAKGHLWGYNRATGKYELMPTDYQAHVPGQTGKSNNSKGQMSYKDQAKLTSLTSAAKEIENMILKGEDKNGVPLLEEDETRYRDQLYNIYLEIDKLDQKYSVTPVTPEDTNNAILGLQEGARAGTLRPLEMTESELRKQVEEEGVDLETVRAFATSNGFTIVPD